MPPKTRGNKSGGSKKDDENYREKLDRYRQEVELEKAENEIKFLNLLEKISRLENELKITEAKNHELRHIISTKNKENQDLFEQQEYEMRIKDQRIKEMEKDHKKANVEMEKMKARHEKEKSHMQQEFDQQKQLFQQKIDKLQENLDELHTFKKQKSKILKENSVLKEQIQKTEKYTSDSIEKAKEHYHSSLREKEEELQHEFQRKQEELRAATDKHIGVKTLNTMKKNEYLRRELETQQIESKKMLETNNMLVEQNRELKQQNSIYEAEKDELLRKVNHQKKIINNLKERQSNLGVDGSPLSSALNGDATRNPMRSSNSLSGESPSNSRISNHLKERLSEKEELLQLEKQSKTELEKKYEELQKKYEVLDASLNQNRTLEDEISKFLIATMNDIKLKLGPWKSIDSMYHKREDSEWKPNSIIPASLDKLTVKERESVIRYLLSKLHQFDKSLRKKGHDLRQLENSNETQSVLPPIHHNVSFQDRFQEFKKQQGYSF